MSSYYFIHFYSNLFCKSYLHNSPNELWITVLSLSLGTILPSPKVRKSKIAGGGGGSSSNSSTSGGSVSGELPTHSFP